MRVKYSSNYNDIYKYLKASKTKMPYQITKQNLNVDGLENILFNNMFQFNKKSPGGLEAAGVSNQLEQPVPEN